MKLPVDAICTSHGVIWRDKPLQVVERYMKWASDFRENQITIAYDTMWDGTRALAEAIARGLFEQAPLAVPRLQGLVRHIERETLDSALMSARSVLEVIRALRHLRQHRAAEPHPARGQIDQDQHRVAAVGPQLRRQRPAHVGDERARAIEDMHQGVRGEVAVRQARPLVVPGDD